MQNTLPITHSTSMQHLSLRTRRQCKKSDHLWIPYNNVSVSLSLVCQFSEVFRQHPSISSGNTQVFPRMFLAQRVHDPAHPIMDFMVKTSLVPALLSKVPSQSIYWHIQSNNTTILVTSQFSFGGGGVKESIYTSL